MTGAARIRHRLIRTAGLRVATINVDEWGAQATDEDREALLEDALAPYLEAPVPRASRVDGIYGETYDETDAEDVWPDVTRDVPRLIDVQPPAPVAAPGAEAAAERKAVEDAEAREAFVESLYGALGGGDEGLSARAVRKLRSRERGLRNDVVRILDGASPAAGRPAWEQSNDDDNGDDSGNNREGNGQGMAIGGGDKSDAGVADEQIAAGKGDLAAHR
jgi:hypothetical protein